MDFLLIVFSFNFSRWECPFFRDSFNLSLAREQMKYLYIFHNSLFLFVVS